MPLDILEILILDARVNLSFYETYEFVFKLWFFQQK